MPLPRFELGTPTTIKNLHTLKTAWLWPRWKWAFIMEDLQLCQNKMLRTIENVKLSDKVRSEYMLKKHNFLSVNQTMAQIKFTIIIKAIK